MFLYLLCDQNTSQTINSWFSHLVHWMSMKQLNLLFSTSLKSLRLPFENHNMDVDLEIQAPSLAGLDVSTVLMLPFHLFFLLETIFLVPLACRLETTTWKLTRKSRLQPQLILVSGSQQQLIFFFRLLQTLETIPLVPLSMLMKRKSMSHVCGKSKPRKLVRCWQYWMTFGKREFRLWISLHFWMGNFLNYTFTVLLS